MTSLYRVIICCHIVIIWVMLLFKGSKPELASLQCLLTYFSVDHPWLLVSCLSSHQLYWYFTRVGLRRSPLTSYWKVFPYRRWHLALRTGLEPHPSPIFIIDRSPCAQHRSILWVFDWVVSLVFDISLHYHTLGFMQYLGFHLTLLVDTSPLCQLSLLVGSKGFYHVLATSCCHAERVNLADKTNLPRSLRLSSDKQDNWEQSFSKHAFTIQEIKYLDPTCSPTLL